MHKMNGGRAMVYHSNRKFVSVILMIVVVLTVTLWISSASYAYEELIDRQAGIRVSALPISLSRGKQVRIRVWISDRSGEMNQDLLKTSTLVDEQGKEYQLISSTQLNSGGSQYVGELLFQSTNIDAKMIKLQIKAVGGVETRVFKWALQ